MIIEFLRVDWPYLICYLMTHFPSPNQILYHQNRSSKKALNLSLKNVIGGKSVAKSFKLSPKLTLIEVSGNFICYREFFVSELKIHLN